jgi:hypothetical protein
MSQGENVSQTIFQGNGHVAMREIETRLLLTIFIDKLSRGIANE